MGWGSLWGRVWGGGASAPSAPAPAPAVTGRPSGIIDQFVANVRAILHGTQRGGRFLEAGYRRKLEDSPAGGANGMFHVEAVTGKQGRPFWGGPDTIRELGVNVRVAYWRSADRRQANRDAIADSARIGDLCENPANYSYATTGIRSVRMLGAARVVNAPQLEIWEVRFTVEWEQTGVYLASVIPPTAPSGGFVITVATIAALGAYPNALLPSGQFLAWVLETSRFYRLDAASGTADGVTIIAANDGRMWFVT